MWRYEFCYGGVCNTQAKACTESNTDSTGEQCSCSGNMCQSNEFCYGGVCNAAGKACPVSYVDALAEDCVCAGNSKCTTGKFCHSGGCQNSKCTARASKRMFYGATLHGEWDSTKKSMKTFIEVPFEVSITSIDWRNANTDDLKYTTTNNGHWELDRASQTCKIRYTLDVNQNTFFGQGSKFTITGQQMKTYITVSAEQMMDEEQHGHHYTYTRHISNLIPVLVNLRPTTTINVKFTVFSPEGGDEFVLFLDATDETSEEGGKVTITMEVHSKNCVDTQMNDSASGIINGVSVQKGQEHIKAGTYSSFTWKTKTNAQNEIVLDEKFLYNYCVQTVTWSFTPAELTASTNTFNINLQFQNRGASSTFVAVATVDLEVADVLGDIGFDGEITLYEDRDLQTPEEEFYLGEKFWAKIALQQMIVDAASMECTEFKVSQTVDGIAEETDMTSLPQYNFEQFTPANTVNTIACGAELDSPHFHKSENGKDSELIVEVTINYKQGDQERRILRASLNSKEEFAEEAVAAIAADDSAFAKASRDPDRTDLSAPFSIKGFNPVKVVEAFEKESINLSSERFGNKLYFCISLGSFVFGLMLVYQFWRKTKSQNESIQFLLMEDDI